MAITNPDFDRALVSLKNGDDSPMRKHLKTLNLSDSQIEGQISSLKNNFANSGSSSATGAAAAAGLAGIGLTGLMGSGLSGGLTKIAGIVIGSLNKITTGMIDVAASTFQDQLANQRDISSSYLASLLKNATNSISINPVDMANNLLKVALEASGKLLQDAYDNEGKMLTAISRDGGIMGEFAGVMSNEMLDAAVEAQRFGVSLDDTAKAAGSLSKNSGQTKLYMASTISDALKVSQTFTSSADAIISNVEGFRSIGYGLQDASKIIEKTGKSSLSQGLNARETSATLMKNLGKLNEYGFKNGVDGLKNMVQQAQSLKFNMDDIFKVADKVFEPEGAIDMSAKLQMIGGAFGDLSDPMKAMYDATNNMEGLQSSILDAAKSLATYNVEQGRFEVTGINLRRAKAMADATGVSMAELTGAAVKGANQMEIMSKLDMFPQFDKEQKEFVKNIAQIGKGGRVGIEVPKELRESFGAGTDGFLELSNLNGKQIAALQTYQEKIGGASIEDLNRSQFTVQTQMMSDINSIYLILQNEFRSKVKTTNVYDLMQAGRESLMNMDRSAVQSKIQTGLDESINKIPGIKAGEVEVNRKENIKKEIETKKAQNESTINLNIHLTAENLPTAFTDAMMKNSQNRAGFKDAIADKASTYIGQQVNANMV